MLKNTITFLFLSLLMIACQNNKIVNTKDVEQSENTKKEMTFVEKVENTHQKTSFLKNEVIQFDASVEFDGKNIFDASITISTSSDIATIHYKNGGKIYVDKGDIFVSPDLKDNKGVRFHAYTWSYFFLFPYKLNDDGTIWSDITTKDDANFNTKKLTFKPNTGDAPDDWYIVYANKDNNQLEHVAYIVTAGKTKEEAEKDPHAIKYLDYKTIDGIPFATNWDFYEWNLEDGLTKVIGNATISNIKFVNDFRVNFSVPENFIKR